MRRLTKVSYTVFALTALLAFGCASDPTADKPEAEVGDAQAPANAASEGVELPFDEGSTISWVGSKVTGSHDGGFNSFEGSVTLVDNDPTQSSVNVTIDTTSLWADNERLTGHLKSADFFEVETYPTATFESTAIEAAEDGYSVTGNLELHGVEKSITFPAHIEVTDGAVTVHAEFAIKRFDFGIEYTGPSDNLIRDDVLIKLALTAGGGAADAPADGHAEGDASH